MTCEVFADIAVRIFVALVMGISTGVGYGLIVRRMRKEKA